MRRSAVVVSACRIVNMLALLTLVLLFVDETLVASARTQPFLGSSFATFGRLSRVSSAIHPSVFIPRGGSQEELTLDEKVHAAMEKLGLSSPGDGEEATADSDDDCQDGVCVNPNVSSSDSSATPGDGEQAKPAMSEDTKEEPIEVDVYAVAKTISEDMNVDPSLAMAALGATATFAENGSDRLYHEQQARNMIQQELDIISQVPEDSEQVQQLVSEGFDLFLSRRALAFAEHNLDDARAILLADKMDEEEEEQARQQKEQEEEAELEKQKRQEARETMPAMKTVEVNSNFDPLASTPAASAPAPAPADNMPKPAQKSDVVFEATAADLQSLVLESPVPVLLDCYADWCGPCKALTPVLEEMAVKAGGAFRLVKLNTDNERAAAGALEVTSLPTVFGVRDGKILHMFKGMPNSEKQIRGFMMGLLMPGAQFEPPVTDSEKEMYAELSSKLIKVAGSACFSFSARERLQSRISTKLDELTEQTADFSEAEKTVKIIRSLLANVIKDPFDFRFRSVNLENTVVAARVAGFPAAVGLLKSVGFAPSGDGKLVLGKTKKLVNVAPLAVARDSLDQWVERTKYEVLKAERKRHDEQERDRLQAEGAFDSDDEEQDETVKDEIDPNVCKLQLRLEGKKKVHEVVLDADEPLRAVLDSLPIKVKDGEEVQITCIAKRLVVKSADDAKMNKSLRDLRLLPSSALVVSVGTPASKQESSASKLSERAAKKKKKTGSHTMQSIGVYSKDDNAKGELIDGGGGVLYEHDVSDTDDDEEELPTAADDVEEEDLSAEGDDSES